METKTKLLKKNLLIWYKENKRTFNWRYTNDPWKILLIEIISQQTQINRANIYYQEFIKKFPTPESMSQSSLKTILKMWSGLGYNNRAIRLYESSKLIAEKGKNMKEYWIGSGEPKILQEYVKIMSKIDLFFFAKIAEFIIRFIFRCSNKYIFFIEYFT